jgi:hypothetical protein
MAIKLFRFRKIILIILVCIISNTITAQKSKIDTLSVEQLKMYSKHATDLKNSGMFLTFFGAGIIATGIIAGEAKMNHPDPNDEYSEMGGEILMGLCVIVGGSFSIAGISLWTVGAKRKSKAELTLQKFSMMPANSPALGLGIRLRF